MVKLGYMQIKLYVIMVLHTFSQVNNTVQCDI